MSRWVTGKSWKIIKKSRPLIWILTNIVAQPQIGKMIFESFWLVLPFVQFGLIQSFSTHLLGSLASSGRVHYPRTRIWNDLFQSYVTFKSFPMNQQLQRLRYWGHSQGTDWKHWKVFHFCGASKHVWSKSTMSTVSQCMHQATNTFPGLKNKTFIHEVLGDRFVQIISQQ